MTSRDFAYWLQGFFEIDAAGAPKNAVGGLIGEKVDCIKRHLAMVFAHEIDPSMGGAAEQAKLDAIHAAKVNAKGETVFRC